MKKPFLYRPTSTATRVFLVLLRLAIGWHLFIEGAGKLESISVGPTGTGKPFSSKGYLLQSQGPLAPWFRKLAGDPDLRLIALLDSSKDAVPEALQDQWRDYVSRYKTHYQLDQGQQSKADGLLKQHLATLADWFQKGSKEVTKDYPFATITPTQTTSERIKEYRSKLQELKDKIDGWNLRFEKDVTKARVATLKGEVARLRTDLQRDLDDMQEKLGQDLDKLLSKEQLVVELRRLTDMVKQGSESKGYGLDQQAVAELIQAARDSKSDRVPPDAWANGEHKPELLVRFFAGDPEFQKALMRIAKRQIAPALHVEDMRMLEWADRIVAWGLTIVGLGLLLGCFSRLSSLGGAILLLLFYLALPPLPGLPDNPMVEGKYLFVNKNLIEVLALLTLATTASGKWFGVDGLLSLMIPFKYFWPKPILVQPVEKSP